MIFCELYLKTVQEEADAMMIFFKIVLLSFTAYLVLKYVDCFKSNIVLNLKELKKKLYRCFIKIEIIHV